MKVNQRARSGVTATKYYFDPAHISVPTLAELRNVRWPYVASGRLKNCIVQEEQSLAFHEAILQQLRYEVGAPGWLMSGILDLSLRAGFIRSAVKLYASIAEAALLFHAITRGYIPAAPTGRFTLGQIKSAWEDPPNSRDPRPDVAAIWDDLGKLHDIRNHVHLFEMARGDGDDFRKLNAREKELLGAGRHVLDHLRKMRSP